MSISVSNVTQETCVICYEDYQSKEISNVAKVVELACHHFYHISCISESLKNQENGQRDLTCCYCNQVIASAIRPTDAFANQEIFQARLEEMRKDYDYDSEVMEAVSIVASLYTPLHDLSVSFPLKPNDVIADQENGKKLANAVCGLIIKNEEIKKDVKGTVLLILSAMMIGGRALRTVEGEAKRWRRIPFENWPEKIKHEGVLVRYEDTRIGISANHLKKVVDKAAVDALVNHFSRSLKVLGVIVATVLVKKALDQVF